MLEKYKAAMVNTSSCIDCQFKKIKTRGGGRLPNIENTIPWDENGGQYSDLKYYLDE
jgi:hypothetical protein